jgi:AcrR family transcriptional regulator
LTQSQKPAKVVGVTATRKERDRQAREELILQHAQRLFTRDGYQDLNLDELAKAVEYSKGTIYLHFQSKEDLALAVATRALKHRADLFERALLFKGSTRERVRAIGYACVEFMVVYPNYFSAELMLKSNSFWEKASTEQQEAHAMEGGRCFRAVYKALIEGQASGDLPASHLSTENLAFSLIAITMGSHIMTQVHDLRVLAGIEDAATVVRANQDLVLDGMGWKPLYRDFDYATSDRRIHDEIFPESNWFKARSK